MEDSGRHPPSPLHLAMIGTRGVPAAYGGFETAVEEGAAKTQLELRDATCGRRPRIGSYQCNPTAARLQRRRRRRIP